MVSINLSNVVEFPNSNKENRKSIKFPQSNSLYSLRFDNISLRPGDHGQFLETRGNCVRLNLLGRSALTAKHPFSSAT